MQTTVTNYSRNSNIKSCHQEFKACINIKNAKNVVPKNYLKNRAIKLSRSIWQQTIFSVSTNKHFTFYAYSNNILFQNDSVNSGSFVFLLSIHLLFNVVSVLLLCTYHLDDDDGDNVDAVS